MKLRTLSFAIIASFFLLMQCKEEETPPPGAITDQQLFDMASTTTGFTYYRNNPAFLVSQSGQAHGSWVRFRYNAVAQAALTDNGKLPTGGTFPEGSLIVKELHGDTTGNDLNGYAIILKAPNDPDARNGWVWAEYFGSPTLGTRVTDDSQFCVNCHSINHRDYNRVFELFP